MQDLILGTHQICMLLSPDKKKKDEKQICRCNKQSKLQNIKQRKKNYTLKPPAVPAFIKRSGFSA